MSVNSLVTDDTATNYTKNFSNSFQFLSLFIDEIGLPEDDITNL